MYKLTSSNFKNVFINVAVILTILIGIESILRPTALIQFAVIFILAVNHKNFKRASDPISIRNGLLLGLVVSGIIVCNTFLTAYVLKIKTSTVSGVYDAVYTTLKMFFLMDPSVLGHISKVELVFAKSEIAIHWIGMATAFIFILNPLVYQPIVTSLDREKVRKLLYSYGDNPVSYVSIEEDKKCDKSCHRYRS